MSLSKKVFGRIHQEMRRKKLPVLEVSRRAGIGDATLRLLLAGKTSPRLDTLEKILEAVGLSILVYSEEDVLRAFVRDNTSAVLKALENSVDNPFAEQQV